MTILSSSVTTHATTFAASELWRSSTTDLLGWHLNGLQATANSLALSNAAHQADDPYSPGSYHGGDYYNGGHYWYGEALAPYHSPQHAFDHAVVSWNATTPPGTWVTLKLRALIGTHWTREYVMGVWASDSGTIRRHSVDGQSDADGRVSTDTLILNSPAKAFQVHAFLFSAKGPQTSPTLLGVGVSAWNDGAVPYFVPVSAARGKTINVSQRSQMIYPNGGEVWCSPTSVSMVMAYWGQVLNRPDLVQPVPSAADHTYDWIYDGNGNWPFSVAYPASFGLETYVARLNDLSQIEAWVAHGLPVVVSISYAPGALPGTPIPASDGHLIVIVGFDSAGNPITNDPAANPTKGQSVRITYPRTAFTRAWQGGSDGMAYLIFPRGTTLPTENVAGSWPTGTQPFADPAIAGLWATSDQPVATHSANRSWVWGPQPDSSARLEAYAEAPNGFRTVQYFDKSRMEITQPAGDRNSRWFVTNGLLTVELVSGRQQVGDSAFVNGTPAQIPVAGDPESTQTPTYATFNALATLPGTSGRSAADNTHKPILTRLSRAGSMADDAGLSTFGVNYAHYDTRTGHNIPDRFWQWMNDPASGLGDPLFVLGLPISEPYWVQTIIAGQPRTVLVQLFERRALTYNPANTTPWQVEMGNIGQHYYRWRYGN